MPVGTGAFEWCGYMLSKIIWTRWLASALTLPHGEVADCQFKRLSYFFPHIASCSAFIQPAANLASLFVVRADENVANQVPLRLREPIALAEGGVRFLALSLLVLRYSHAPLRIHLPEMPPRLRRTRPHARPGLRCCLPPLRRGPPRPTVQRLFPEIGGFAARRPRRPASWRRLRPMRRPGRALRPLAFW